MGTHNFQVNFILTQYHIHIHSVLPFDEVYYFIYGQGISFSFIMLLNLQCVVCGIMISWTK